jgi:peptidoglycan/xylan/chitin deacetylase (PgdA/CDA1 family)
MTQETFKLRFHNTNLIKTSVCFTWDDNLIRQIQTIAPLFNKCGLKCTFYIVPGEKYFYQKYGSGYYELARQGFELGSHSYLHKHMTKLSELKVSKEFEEAIKRFKSYFQFYPITFAFPNHDYNQCLVKKAYSYHLETRNTLTNSIRFSLKTNTTFEELVQVLNAAIKSKQNLVFNGHSIISEEEYQNKEPGEGYEPIRVLLLEKFLDHIVKWSRRIDIVTFAQAALKEFVRKNATKENNVFMLNSDSLLNLQKYEISSEILLGVL